MMSLTGRVFSRMGGLRRSAIAVTSSTSINAPPSGSTIRNYSQIGLKRNQACFIKPQITQMTQQRTGAGPQPKDIKFVEERAVLVTQLFDKVKNPDSVNLDSHFINDLGLDSLDHVEIIIQMEDEFQLEIPDADAERLMTPRLLAQYICDHDEVYE